MGTSQDEQNLVVNGFGLVNCELETWKILRMSGSRSRGSGFGGFSFSRPKGITLSSSGSNAGFCSV